MWEQNWIGTAVLSLCAVYAFWAIYARVCARMYTGGAARVTEDSDNKHANTHARKRAHDWGHAIAEFGARGTDEGGGCASGLPRHADSLLVGGVSGSNAASECLLFSHMRIGAAVLSSITPIALRTFVVVVAGCSVSTSGCSSLSASLWCGVPMRCRTCESGARETSEGPGDVQSNLPYWNLSSSSRVGVKRNPPRPFPGVVLVNRRSIFESSEMAVSPETSSERLGA